MKTFFQSFWRLFKEKYALASALGFYVLALSNESGVQLVVAFVCMWIYILSELDSQGTVAEKFQHMCMSLFFTFVFTFDSWRTQPVKLALVLLLSIVSLFGAILLHCYIMTDRLKSGGRNDY